MGTEEGDFSIANEIPAPMVIRRFRYLHKLWRNPVAQRHIWNYLRWLNFKKYTEDPDLFRRRVNLATKVSFPIGFLLAVLIYFIQYIPQFMNSRWSYLVFQVPIILFMLTIVIIQLIRKRPFKRMAPLPVFVHDMFDNSKLDALLVTPLSDGEMITSIVFGHIAVIITNVINSLLVFAGLVIGLLAFNVVGTKIGLDADILSVMPIIAISVGVITLIVMPFYMMVGLAAQFLITGAAVRMNYMAAQLFGVVLILCLIFFPNFIGPMAFGMVSTFETVVIFVTGYIVILFFSIYGSYKFMVHQFGSRRRGR